MNNLKDYNLIFNKTESFCEEGEINKHEQKNPSLRANVCVTIALIGGLSLSPSPSLSAEYNFNIEDSSIKSVSDEKGEKVTCEIAEYSEKLNEKYFADKNIFVENILSFRALEHSWDGYGAFPLGVKCASNAIKLLDHFETHILTKVSDMYPNPNGTITFEWENKDDEIVSLEIGKDTFTYFVDFNSLETEFYDKKSFSPENIRTLKKNISAI